MVHMVLASKMQLSKMAGKIMEVGCPFNCRCQLDLALLNQPWSFFHGISCGINSPSWWSWIWSCLPVKVGPENVTILFVIVCYYYLSHHLTPTPESTSNCYRFTAHLVRMPRSFTQELAKWPVLLAHLSCLYYIHAIYASLLTSISNAELNVVSLYCI